MTIKQLLIALIKPLHNPNVTTESLRVEITKSHIEVDIMSLLTNDRVAEQATRAIEACEGMGDGIFQEEDWGDFG